MGYVYSTLGQSWDQYSPSPAYPHPRIDQLRHDFEQLAKGNSNLLNVMRGGFGRPFGCSDTRAHKVLKDLANKIEGAAKSGAAAVAAAGPEKLDSKGRALPPPESLTTFGNNLQNILWMINQINRKKCACIPNSGVPVQLSNTPPNDPRNSALRSLGSSPCETLLRMVESLVPPEIVPTSEPAAPPASTPSATTPPASTAPSTATPGPSATTPPASAGPSGGSGPASPNGGAYYPNEGKYTAQQQLFQQGRGALSPSGFSIPKIAIGVVILGVVGVILLNR